MASPILERFHSCEDRQVASGDSYSELSIAFSNEPILNGLKFFVKTLQEGSKSAQRILQTSPINRTLTRLEVLCMYSTAANSLCEVTTGDYCLPLLSWVEWGNLRYDMA